MLLKITSLILLISILSSICLSQDQQGQTGDRGQSNRVLSLSPEDDTVIDDIPEASDTTFVETEQPGSLDTGCTYQQGSPLVIGVPVNRVVSRNTQATGRLQPDEASFLVSKGYLSPYALVRFPSWDVDRAQGEIDKVFFNGFELDHPIEGANQVWYMNEFKVPIQYVNFGRLSATGGPPIAMNNYIRIDIDTTGAGWCTSVDWVSMSFKAMSPIVLVHGNTSDHLFFTRQHFIEGLDEEHLLYDDTLDFQPNANERVLNAGQLVEHLGRVQDRYGVNSLHIVAHSKGGLDTREFLASYSLWDPETRKGLNILSLSTLSTPHNGSVAADLSTSYTRATSAEFRYHGWDDVPAVNQLLFWANDRFNGVNGGHNDLRTDVVNTFNIENIGALRGLTTQFNTVSADADTNNSQSINTLGEISALATEDRSLNFLYYANPAAAIGSVDSLYQLIRTRRQIRVIPRTVVPPNPVEPVRIVAVITGFELPSDSFEKNDTLVTLSSGQGRNYFGTLVGPGHSQIYIGAEGRNHSNVANKNVALVVAGWAREAERANGDLK